ncbi:lipopolysaccharide heptosyltransferase II [Bradyrhizobium sp. LM6.10]
MNKDSQFGGDTDRSDTRPILIVPYMWIGDFVRNHTVVRVLKERWPNRPIDLLTTSLCAPLVDYMPGVREGVVWDLPRSQLAVGRQLGLAKLLRERNYGTALVLPRTWKAAIAPALAGIPERVGFVGEFRFGLLNRWRWGEKKLPRFIDKNAALAQPDGAPLPAEWPVPQLRGSGRGHRPLAADQRPECWGGRSAGPRLGRGVKALDLLSRGRPLAGRARL